MINSLGFCTKITKFLILSICSGFKDHMTVTHICLQWGNVLMLEMFEMLCLYLGKHVRNEGIAVCI